GDGRPAGAGRPSPGRAGSAAQALTGLDVEEVHVALLRTEVDRLSLRRRTPAVDTSDERLGDLVRSGAAAMDVGVGTELLDQIDLDRDALLSGTSSRSSGRTPRVTEVSSVSDRVSRSTGSTAPPNCTPWSVSFSSTKFMAGEPMKPATKTLSGWSYMRRGVSIC